MAWSKTTNLRLPPLLRSTRTATWASVWLLLETVIIEPGDEPAPRLVADDPPENESKTTTGAAAASRGIPARATRRAPAPKRGSGPWRRWMKLIGVR
ncbi:MAG: hypothetical protein H6711_18675 [Myxococcales bacterium]|nr:hypothetical protein [Myxococcales bacterium]